jgi:hypothetical protein
MHPPKPNSYRRLESRARVSGEVSVMLPDPGAFIVTNDNVAK